MTQEEIAIESEPTYIVALGRDDLAEDAARADDVHLGAASAVAALAAMSHQKGDAKPLAG